MTFYRGVCNIIRLCACAQIITSDRFTVTLNNSFFEYKKNKALLNFTTAES